MSFAPNIRVLGCERPIRRVIMKGFIGWPMGAFPSIFS